MSEINKTADLSFRLETENIEVFVSFIKKYDEWELYNITKSFDAVEGIDYYVGHFMYKGEIK